MQGLYGDACTAKTSDGTYLKSIRAISEVSGSSKTQNPSELKMKLQVPRWIIRSSSPGVAKPIFNDVWRHVFFSWILVPAGTLCFMLLLFGLRSLIDMGSVELPPNVILLIALFLLLVVLERYVLSKERMELVIDVLSVPLDFTLRYINLFFTPPFIMLPRTAEAPTPSETGKIIAVFLIGWLITTPIMAWMVRGYNQLSEGTFLDFSREARAKRASVSAGLPFYRKRSQVQGGSFSTQNTLVAGDIKRADNSASSSQLPTADPSSLTLADEKDAKEDMAMDNQTTRTEDIEAGQTTSESRSSKMKAFAVKHIDHLTWGALFVFIGLPTYFSTNYSMPAFLSMNILIFFACNEIPRKPFVPKTVRLALHPIITTTCFMILGIWFLASIKHGFGGDIVRTLTDALGGYQVGNTHHTLFDPHRRGTLPNPGAGDFLSSLLEVSVVGFALPMYRYRRELFQFIVPLLISVLGFCVACLFLYPLICRAIGMTPEHAAGFAARSVSMPLAIIVAENIEADVTLTAALAAVSGVLGALLGLHYLKLFRIPDDDFVSRGISLGCNSAAPMTALLLEVDPPAAALSSLSLSLLGIFMIILTVIPTISEVVMSLSGMG